VSTMDTDPAATWVDWIRRTWNCRTWNWRTKWL